MYRESQRRWPLDCDYCKRGGIGLMKCGGARIPFGPDALARGKKHDAVWRQVPDSAHSGLQPKQLGVTMKEPNRIFLFTRFTGQMLLLLGLLAGTARLGSAQSTATLQGTVNDPSGNPIAGAKGVARNEGTGVG